jgi:hypothetical protein
MENNNIDKVTRFEVIDDSGRVLVRYGIKIELSFQDDDRTLKVFLTSKNKPTNDQQETNNGND